MTAWVGVDLDGTLAEYTEWHGPDYIGRPIPIMLQRVRKWLAEGVDIRIFTARVHPGNPDANESRNAIEKWCRQNLGIVIPITNQKDYGMVELWDDRCVQVIPNTGLRADGRS